MQWDQARQVGDRPATFIVYIWQDDELRQDEICRWLEEMDEPEKFMMQFVQQNDINANGKKSSWYSFFNRLI